jgi:exodeoxyribonuclease III
MKLATWNVNSITARLPLVLQWVEAATPDVLCMQEIKCTDDKFPAEAFAELGYQSEAFGQPTYNGVAIVSRFPIEDVRRGFPEAEPGAHSRLIAAKIQGINVVNVYVPNGSTVGSEKYIFKLNWMNRLRLFFKELYKQTDPVLVCGDFNVAPEDRDVHDPLAWRGNVLVSPKERVSLEKIKEWGFIDAFRLHTDAGGFYSWWDYRQGAFQKNDGLRIDHIWVTKALADACKQSWIDKAPREWERPSDHTPVLAEFSPMEGFDS